MNSEVVGSTLSEITVSMPSSMDTHTCRICLEESYREELIAPCHCRGTSKYVHRECLDRWRYTREDRAFSKCTECLKEYRLVPRHGDSLKAARERRIMFMLLVSRDVFLAFACTQILIAILALVSAYLDSSQTLLGWFSSTAHPRIFYFGFGTFLFFAIIGIFAIIQLCLNNELRDMTVFDCCHRSDWTTCFYLHHSPHCCNPGYCYTESIRDCCTCASGETCGCLSGDCLCCASASSADCGECLPLLIPILALFALLGIFISVFAGMAYISRTIARQMEITQKRGLVGDFIVADLDSFYAENADENSGNIINNQGYAPVKMYSLDSIRRDEDIESGIPAEERGPVSSISAADQGMLRGMGLL